MFTGIIEEAGSFIGLTGGEISIGCRKVLEDVKLGDSISTNGICLTVTGFDDRSFRADVMPETMRRTSLSDLKIGARINLERALKLGDRLGGHIVSGHIDGVGRIVSIKREGNAKLVEVEADRSILKQIVEKGSVALDGMSLTVASVSERSFGVSLIPHTIENTNFMEKNIGSPVNIETDLIGKYIERLMVFEKSSARSSITRDFLTANGF